uniref:EF-hand calcium-binding domain-containing protein 5 n=1 Tax=Pogona vitticeps TaxID=103695 RepID=A0ABM5ENK9_9SAUR
MADEPEKTEEGVEKSSSEPLVPELELAPPPVAVRALSPEVDARWKAVFYESLQPRALILQEARVAKRHREKMLERKQAKAEPPDPLSQDWLEGRALGLETRAYLLDKLLPTLVPGVEKLLRVAERKKALPMDGGPGPGRLDPLNFLGEFLMRQNPSYQLAAQPNPYVRGMQAVTEELKTQVPETTPHRLAEVKALVEEKRQQREQVEKIKSRVEELRKLALALQFKEWTRDTSGQIPLALIQSALRSFLEVVPSAATDSEKGIYARPLETVTTLEVKVNEEEFVEYLLSYIKPFSSDLFQQLLRHLLQCANDARDAIRHDIWRRMFLQLFLDCDHGKVGLLDRPRVLSLLESYYDHSLERARKGCRDPRKWPIVELDDIDLSEFWGDLRDDGEASSEEPTPRVPTPPPRRLSEEAAALTLILQGILSEVDVAAPEARMEAPEPEGSATGEGPPQGPGGGGGGVRGAAEEEEPLPAAQAPPDGTGAGPGQAEGVAGASPPPEPPEVAPDRPEGEEEEAAGRKSPEEAEEGEGSAPSSFHQVGDPQPSAPAPSLDELQGLEGAGGLGGASLAELAASLQKWLEGQPRQEEEEEEEEEERGGGPGAPGEEPPARQEEEEEEEKSAGEPPAEGGAGPREKAPGAARPGAPPAGGGGGGGAPPAGQPVPPRGAPQLICGEPWSGELPVSDLSFKYTDYGKEVREDWDNENSRFPDLRMNMIEIQARGPPSSTSAFEKDSLNLPQFVQLMETFVGEQASFPVLKKLVQFVKEGYVQTEKEKIHQLERVRQNSFVAWRELLLAALFEKWDNECSGFLDMKEVDAVLSTFKEGMEQEALNKAKLQLPIPQWHPSGVVKLTRKDFQAYVELVVSELTGNEDEVLDNMVEFLMMAVERTHQERLRGSARRKWLLQIEQAAKTSGGCPEPVYQAVFKALCRDADAHGDSKKISASISLLEYNLIVPARGDILLRYVACTEDDAPYMLNQTLFMDMNGVSFAAALEDKPIHVPRVQLHGNVHFWNHDRPIKERKGSFLVLPLEDIRRRVFGVLGLDTLRDKSGRALFVPHEIRFYQGVANMFSRAYHHLRTRESLVQVIFTALEWLSARAPALRSITAYFMEPGENRMYDYTLRKALSSDLKGPVDIPPPPAPVLSRKENNFSRGYLFRCIDSSLVVAAHTYQEHHIAVPLRNPKGQAILVFDLNLGPRERLPSCEHKDLQKMLKMVQAATCEILKEDSGDLEPYYVLEAEYVGDWRRGGVLFYRFMLQDLQNCIWNLDPWLCFGEIQCFQQPPPLVHTILKSVLLVLYPQWAGTEEVENWKCCIQKFDGELIENICYFDPTAAYVVVRPEILYACLQGAPRKAVWQFGSAALEHLFNWTQTCLALIQLAKKLQHHESSAPSSSALLTPTLSRSLRSSQISSNPTNSLA